MFDLDIQKKLFMKSSNKADCLQIPRFANLRSRVETFKNGPSSFYVWTQYTYNTKTQGYKMAQSYPESDVFEVTNFLKKSCRECLIQLLEKNWLMKFSTEDVSA